MELDVMLNQTGITYTTLPKIGPVCVVDMKEVIRRYPLEEVEAFFCDVLRSYKIPKFDLKAGFSMYYKHMRGGLLYGIYDTIINQPITKEYLGN